MTEHNTNSYILKLNDTEEEIADTSRIIEYASNRLLANEDDRKTLILTLIV